MGDPRLSYQEKVEGKIRGKNTKITFEDHAIEFLNVDHNLVHYVGVVLPIQLLPNERGNRTKELVGYSKFGM